MMLNFSSFQTDATRLIFSSLTDDGFNAATLTGKKTREAFHEVSNGRFPMSQWIFEEESAKRKRV